MRASCQVCIQFCFVRRLLVLLPNFVVVVEHINFWGNHPFWPSNITDIDQDGWNITCRLCQDSYIKYNPLRKYNSLGSPLKRDIPWPSRSISLYCFVLFFMPPHRRCRRHYVSGLSVRPSGFFRLRDNSSITWWNFIKLGTGVHHQE